MIRKELSLFLVVGSTTVIIDYLIYRGLLLFSVNLDLAKVVGFLVGTTFAYFANRTWTFSHIKVASTANSLSRFLIVYIINLLLNVGANRLALELLGSLHFAVTLAFILATGLSASANFIGMKLFVFPNSPSRSVST